MLRKLHIAVLLILLSFISSLNFSVHASTDGILPPAQGENYDIRNYSEKDCVDFLRTFLSVPGSDKTEVVNSTDKGDQILACAIKSGQIKPWMIPFFLRNVLEFLIKLGGLITVLMIMVGAYYYMAGGLTEDKETGKNIIVYAIGGLVLTILAWFIVNVILLAVTS